jgi:hypothetical protein
MRSTGRGALSLGRLPSPRARGGRWRRRTDELEVCRGPASELDDMWSYVTKKANPRRLWHAIDDHTGKVLASVFGRRKDGGVPAPSGPVRAVWHHPILY